MSWALVTGAGKRLGRATALELAQAGYDIVVHFGRSVAEADSAAQAIIASGRQAITLGADLADAAAPAALIAAATASGRCLTALINCASIFEHDTITDFSEAAFANHMRVNAFAPVGLAQAFAAALPADQRGVIVNFLDFKLTQPYGDHLSYTLSKYALAGATEILARALAPRIRVNAVAPGYALPSPEQSDEDFQRLHGQTPLARGTTSEEVARAVAFLCANEAVTAQTILVDSGLRFRSFERDLAFM
jgi:NAD(P)-dependent dehydrogenase (short-subunit alcohol dehydrogenase family)